MDNQQKQQYMEEFNSPYCNLITKYEKLAKIGQGTFGEVFKARDKTKPENLVAVKRVLMETETEGFPLTTIRELKVLRVLKHENIINLIEVCRKEGSTSANETTFYLVFDFCEHDLYGLLANPKVTFSLGEIKKVLQQILNGLYFIHSSKILHRDLKPSNILITKNGVIKIADFGLARPFSVFKDQLSNNFTSVVVTLWYRAPELLLGEKNYGPAIDLWSFGCVMAELWTRFPIMQANTEHQQLLFISKLCGSITPEVWPNVVNLELYRQLMLPTNEPRKITQSLLPYIPEPLALDLIERFLVLDPSKRINSNDALNHDFFWTDPLPSDLSTLLSNYKISMFEYNAPKGPSTSATEDEEYVDRIY